MACIGCGENQELGNNPTSPIPIKVGQPLSSACERATIAGSIPVVIRYAGWTLVNGGTVENRVSDGGICNPASFFKTRNGCFYNKNGQNPCSSC